LHFPLLLFYVKLRNEAAKIKEAKEKARLERKKEYEIIK